MNSIPSQSIEKFTRQTRIRNLSPDPLVYYPTAKKLQLLLPLALEDKKRIDVALVCNHVYKPEEGVNNYEGRTIFTLQMAYNNARLITRPDSDWLMADMAINK